MRPRPLARSRHVWLACSILGIISAIPGPTGAQATVGIRVDTMAVPVAEGVSLRTVVWRAANQGKAPVVLVRTPYGVRNLEWLGRPLAEAGYVVVLQDVRGTGGAQERFVPFAFETGDGMATLEWTKQQDWSDGRIALWGISYQAYAAMAIAQGGDPSVRAVVFIAGFADLDAFLRPGGVFPLMAHLPWFMSFGSGGRLPPREALGQIFQTRPLSSLLPGAERLLAVRPFDASKVRAPTLVIGGWYDYTNRTTLALFDQLRSNATPANSGHRLIVGSWAHNDIATGRTRVGATDFGPAAEWGLDSVAKVTRRWLDLQFGRAAPEPFPIVRYFLVGPNSWQTSPRWPPVGTEVTRWYPARSGRLQEGAHLGGRDSVSLLVDPDNPTPTLGGVLAHFFPEEMGPVDQRTLLSRQDVAVFTSEPLPRGAALIGPQVAIVRVRPGSPAFDLAARLTAVAPDGCARLIDDGITRLVGQSAGIESIVRVDIGTTATVIPPGYRLQVILAGTNFPKFDRNPQTGESGMGATVFRAATHTLLLGGDEASRLELTGRAPTDDEVRRTMLSCDPPLAPSRSR